MANLLNLRNSINRSEKDIKYLALRSGIERDRLYSLIAGGDEFKASEITGLAFALNLSDGERNSIFFSGE